MGQQSTREWLGPAQYIYITRENGTVSLNRITGGSSGMWRCDIPDSSGVMQNMYIYKGTDTVVPGAHKRHKVALLCSAYGLLVVCIQFTISDKNVYNKILNIQLYIFTVTYLDLLLLPLLFITPSLNKQSSSITHVKPTDLLRFSMFPETSLSFSSASDPISSSFSTGCLLWKYPITFHFV